MAPVLDVAAGPAACAWTVAEVGLSRRVDGRARIAQRHIAAAKPFENE